MEDNLYIFKGKYYWIVSKGESAAGPYLLQTKWPDLPSAIDAAAFSEKDRKFYFFKGSSFDCTYQTRSYFSCIIAQRL